MKNKNFEKLVKSAQPDFIHNESHKVDLKRRILNSKKFNRNPLLNILKTREFVFTFTLILAVGLIYIFYLSGNTSANLPEIIQNLNASYAGFMSPGKVNSFESNVELATRTKEPFLIRNNIFQDAGNNNIYAKTSDIFTNETIYQLMKIDSNCYHMENPKLQFYNTINSGQVRLVQTFKSDTIKINPDSMNISNKHIAANIAANFEEEAFLKISRNKITNPELNSFVPKVEVIKIFRETNLDEYLSITPINIINELNTSDSLEIVSHLYDGDSSNDFTFIRIKSQLTKREFRSLVISLSSDSSSEATNFLKNLTVNTDSNSMKWIVKLTDTTAPVSDSFMVFAPQKIKVIKVGNADSKIHEISYAVIKNNNILKLADVSFTNHKLVEYDEDYFNPAARNLVRAYCITSL